ncbi:MAG: hypothetical protein R3E88_18960 [Myxococcota bacterium]
MPGRARASCAFAACALAACALLACAPGAGGFDVGALARAHPGLRAVGPARLGDLAPHFWVAAGERIDFACRWRGDAPVGVHVAGAIAARERALVARAVEALAGATGLALRVESAPAAPGARAIELAIADGPSPDDPQRALARSGDATADCAVRAPPFGGREAAGEGALPAELVAASVRVARARADALGRVVALDDDELLGALLHELGPALGFAGHARAGETVMRGAPVEVRRIARGVAAGRPLRDATLRALYALPSGAIVARAPVDEVTAATASVFADARAEGAELRSRAGDASSEVWWRAPDGARAALRSFRAAGSAAWSRPFALRANAAARAAIRERARRAASPP